MPTYSYSKLIGRIIECCGTRVKFAKLMGVSEHTMSLKLNGKVQWRQVDIARACDILDISYKEIPEYFFTLLVKKN